MPEKADPLEAATVTRIGICGATDGLGVDLEDPEFVYGRCTLPAGHETGGWHQEWRAGSDGQMRLWAEWRGPSPGEQCTICGKDGSVH